MPDITLTIAVDTDWHAAFGDNEDDCRIELARIISAAADRIENGADSFRLHDYNGNRVGTCVVEITEPEPEEDEDEEE